LSKQQLLLVNENQKRKIEEKLLRISEDIERQKKEEKSKQMKAIKNKYDPGYYEDEEHREKAR
jgi:CRISPR/Cas system-associated exonuclease Cas4 (RecB family)